MSLIPPLFLDCVVAIGIPSAEGQTRWVASGFLYGHFLSPIDENTGDYRVYLVTNRHVLEGQQTILLRFNPREHVPAREYALNLESRPEHAGWHAHPDPAIDLAVVRINPHVLDADEIQYNYFLSNQHVATRQILEDSGVTEGDFAYILGFPMGLVGGERSFVLARHGTIARIRDYLFDATKEILMDCMIFPGNSGGPVIIKPELAAIRGTKPVKNAYVIGIVAQALAYQDIAVSRQTGRVRVLFEDNSGLASVVPVQYLVELIESLQSSSDGGRGNTAETVPASP